MRPRERVMATMTHELPDRVPRFEIWIDGLLTCTPAASGKPIRSS